MRLIHPSRVYFHRCDASLIHPCRASSPTKPVWHLIPLPLDHVRPSLTVSAEEHGPVSSLHSHCLDVISRNFHNISTSTLHGMSPIMVRRILNRVRADRGYEAIRESKKNYRPDEATIWAFSALFDPEGTERSHVLALPIPTIISHLSPNLLSPEPEHPLISLPKLYQTISPSSSFHLLTTLTLDATGDSVSDTNILNLRWCSHLTALWMKGCRITDAGIRLLASALQLPGDITKEDAKGMWRLRAWFLRGCTGVSDRSMKAFARWPGLTVLGRRFHSTLSL